MQMVIYIVHINYIMYYFAHSCSYVCSVYSDFIVCCYTQFVHQYMYSQNLAIQLMEQLFECMSGLYKHTMFVAMVMIG